MSLILTTPLWFRIQLTLFAELSKGLWTEIRQRHQDTIDRLILGDSDDHWGVMAETLRAGKVLKDQPFGKASTSFQDHLRELMERFSDYSDVTFAALGGSGHWALNVGGSLRYCGPLSFNKAIREAKDSGKDIVVRVLTTYDGHR